MLSLSIYVLQSPVLTNIIVPKASDSQIQISFFLILFQNRDNKIVGDLKDENERR